MAENEQTKICPFCAETIKAAAKVCPFCRSRQWRYALWGQELLIAVPSVFLIIVAIWVFVQLAPEDNGDAGRSFAGHRNDLVVLSTYLDRIGTKPEIWLTGVVTNQSDFPWRIHELEVRFVDEHGNLLDVSHPEVKDLFVVQPHQVHGFRVQLDRPTFTNNAMRQVYVQTATDGNRPMKKD